MKIKQSDEKKSEEVLNIVWRIKQLPMLPKDFILPTYMYVKNSKPEEVKKTVSAIFRLLGERIDSKKLCSVVLGEELRTNNFLEGYHRHLPNDVGCVSLPGRVVNNSFVLWINISCPIDNDHNSLRRRRVSSRNVEL